MSQFCVQLMPPDSFSLAQIKTVAIDCIFNWVLDVTLAFTTFESQALASMGVRSNV